MADTKEKNIEKKLRDFGLNVAQKLSHNLVIDLTPKERKIPFVFDLEENKNMIKHVLHDKYDDRIMLYDFEVEELASESISRMKNNKKVCELIALCEKQQIDYSDVNVDNEVIDKLYWTAIDTPSDVIDSFITNRFRFSVDVEKFVMKLDDKTLKAAFRELCGREIAENLPRYLKNQNYDVEKLTEEDYKNIGRELAEKRFSFSVLSEEVEHLITQSEVGDIDDYLGIVSAEITANELTDKIVEIKEPDKDTGLMVDEELEDVTDEFGNPKEKNQTGRAIARAKNTSAAKSPKQNDTHKNYGKNSYEEVDKER